MEELRFLTREQVRRLQTEFGTPLFVYDQSSLERQVAIALGFPAPFGLTVRYAMKACPSAAVLRVLTRAGLHIDASSGFEVHRAMAAGVPAERIMLTAQQAPEDLAKVAELGIRFNACSLAQLAAFGQVCPGHQVSVRLNPGLGSGHSNRTNVGGPSASFGIWHSHLERVLATAREHDLKITRLHTHIGSGSDPEVWQRCAGLTINLVRHLPDVTEVNFGGGYKVGRMSTEPSTDLQRAGEPIAAELRRFATEEGRQLHLEIEPGTFFVGNSGAVVASVIDVVDTGKEGYSFIKTDTGMTEILRPSMYGSQHPIIVVPRVEQERPAKDYLVVGHCCESGDILTPEPDNPEGLLTRRLTEARIGDAIVIDGAGAYCAAMSAKNYNSFPEAPEVLLGSDGTFHLARRRQTLEQILQNEMVPEFLR
ncbi:MAG: diaminopimelate decarboxylase [Candidatus Latescibacteria bacterium]|jgi:diaminopimelate decarboxylase|nr:diaminopimelate decarboxylase [Gemmatimonadaceae bacterium]MDP6014761.1 diaminopimelate decarboxylase [Candidatus Latescibacterota bacterium]